MDEILLADPEKAVSENMFKVIQRILPCWELHLASENNTKKKFTWLFGL
jgi:hypothetical protein